jgi:enamine deaminase RidA (YjgF/YER057c/UK114 family)
MYKALLGIAVAGLMAGSAMAAGVEVKRSGASTAPFAESVWAGDTLYVSGILADPDVAGDKDKGTQPAWTSDTKTQATNLLGKIEKILKEQGLGLGDVVQLEAFLAGDPSKGDMMDFAGWNAAYLQFFGTAAQPNKPVRATVQVAHLAAPGAMIEVMVTAVRPKETKKKK